MNETIHYISDISYIVDINHLRKHIKYITRKEAKPLSTLFSSNKIQLWNERAQIEKSKRHDARIAMKFVVALPNTTINDTSFYNKLGMFLSEFFHIPTSHIDITVHRDNPSNLHAHILVYPRDEQGRKLRLSRNDLRRLHKEWDRFLGKNEYKIVKDEPDEKIPHLGWRLYAEPELRTSYDSYKKNKKQKRIIQDNLHKIKKEEAILDAKIKDIEYKIRSIERQIEEEERKRKKQIIEHRIKIMQENRGKLLDLGKLFYRIFEAKKEQERIENERKEIREKMLLLDAVLSQLRNQKQVLEEARRKKVIEERKRQEVLAIRARIIREAQIKIAVLGRQFHDLERKEKNTIQQKLIQEKPIQKPQQATQQAIITPAPSSKQPPPQSEEERIKRQEAYIKSIVFGIEPEPEPENTKENQPTEEKPPPTTFIDLDI